METPRHPEVAGYGPRRRAPHGRLKEATEHEELRRLLREATRLIQSADLRGASEKLKKAGDPASGGEAARPAVSGGRSGRGTTGDRE